MGADRISEDILSRAGSVNHGDSEARAWGWIAAIVVVLAAGVGLVLEDRLWRGQNQPDWIRTKPGGRFGDIQFKYLSIGTERDTGLSYWVFYVLPSMFPDEAAGKSGYGSFGLSWEQTVELPGPGSPR